MNRREFSLQLAGVAGMAALASLGLPRLAFAAAGAPVEGKDYKKLEAPLPEPKTGKVEVIVEVTGDVGGGPHRELSLVVQDDGREPMPEWTPRLLTRWR